MRDHLVIVGFVTALISSAAWGQESAKEGPTPISAEIAADLNALSAPEYKTRETAAKNLLARKLEAVAPLKHLAETGTAEASVRAFELLRQLYREGDDATNEAAENAFDALVQNENPTVASRAEAANDANIPVRRAKAIAAFRKLGGSIRFQSEESDDRNAVDEEMDVIEYAMLDTTWSGGDDGLKYLKRIPDFRIQSEVRRAAVFAIKGSKVSDQAVADLEASIPGLGVQRRGPACFGISAYSGLGESGLVVSSVKAGTAADRAGLIPGDIVLKFNGHELADFNALVDRISEKVPGDKVPVEYVRNGVQDTVTVELRGWRQR